MGIRFDNSIVNEVQVVRTGHGARSGHDVRIVLSLMILLIQPGCDPASGARGVVVDHDKNRLGDVKINVRQSSRSYSLTNGVAGTFDTVSFGTRQNLEFIKAGYKPFKATVGGPFGGVERWEVMMVPTNSAKESIVHKGGN